MANVLLIAPERRRAVDVRSLLRRDGHRVAWVQDVRSWRRAEREVQAEIVVAAMATVTGLEDPQGRPAHGFAAPLLVVQPDDELFGELELNERLVDRLPSPFLREDLLARVDALVRVRRVVRREGIGAAQSGAKRGFTGRLAALFHGRGSRERPHAPYVEVAARVAEWVDRRDAFEPGHASRVASLSAMTAEALRMGEDETTVLLRAAMLHDIGKVALPVEVLHQQAPLDEPQRRLIRTHPARGASLLRALDPDEDVVSAVLHHHERPNGSGYYGKPASAVPRAAWVLAVAEAFDAMTTSRLGHRLTREHALDLLRDRKGDVYDAECVEALVDRLKPRPLSIPLRPLR